MSFYFLMWLLESVKWHTYLIWVAQNKLFGHCSIKQCPDYRVKLFTASTYTFCLESSYQATGTHWAFCKTRSCQIFNDPGSALNQWLEVSWVSLPVVLTFTGDSLEVHVTMFHGVPQQSWAPVIHKANSLDNIPHWALSLPHFTSTHPSVSWIYFPKKLCLHQNLLSRSASGRTEMKITGKTK